MASSPLDTQARFTHQGAQKFRIRVPTEAREEGYCAIYRVAGWSCYEFLSGKVLGEGVVVDRRHGSSLVQRWLDQLGPNAPTS